MNLRKKEDDTERCKTSRKMNMSRVDHILNEEVDPLNTSATLFSESEPDDVMRFEDAVEPEIYDCSCNEVHSRVELGTTSNGNGWLKSLVERDLYWTRVRAHEFYQEMIRRGFVFEERPNEAINVSIEDEKSPSSEPRGSLHDAYYVEAVLAAERSRQENVRTILSRSGPFKGQVTTAPAVRECTFAGFLKCNPAAFHGVEGAYTNCEDVLRKLSGVFKIVNVQDASKEKFVAADIRRNQL
ncbi:hypothetical protein Tco_0535102 [Tanacetum coccineum]